VEHFERRAKSTIEQLNALDGASVAHASNVVDLFFDLARRTWAGETPFAPSWKPSLWVQLMDTANEATRRIRKVAKDAERSGDRARSEALEQSAVKLDDATIWLGRAAFEGPTMLSSWCGSKCA
jgi:hypothetical protein